jgi:hypothetical protein
MLPSDRLTIVNGSGSIHGNSLVAKTPFKRGDFIMPLMGVLSVRTYRTIQIEVSSHLEGTVAAFLNHSCQPTSIVQASTLSVHAAKDLKAGDEITFFYPSTEWDMARPFKCLCGAQDCIGFVAGARYLSMDTFTHYFVNPHIKALLVETPLRGPASGAHL